MIHRTPNAEPRRGVVLIVVLVVVVLLTLAAYQYSDLMLAEYKASISFQRAAQARALAESGVNYAAVMLSDKDALKNLLDNNPYDNPTRFREIPVGTNDKSASKAYFSVISPLGPGESSTTQDAWRYGVTDESGKVNLNALVKLDSSGTVAVEILKKIGIPEETANCILDWIDADSTPRTNGAEDETYSQMGYRCKNGPIDTLEELLLVKGVTPELLFGNDINRNGLGDGMEAGERNLGWQAYLTVYSREQNVDTEGYQRLFLNAKTSDKQTEALKTAIGEEMTNYLLLFRRLGPAPEQIPPGTTTIMASDITKADLSSGQDAGRNLSSVFDLIGTKVLIPGPMQAGGQRPGGQPAPMPPGRLVECPLNDKGTARELLPKMLDKLSATDGPDLPARINILSASELVLSLLPGLVEGDAAKILGSRPEMGSEQAADALYSSTAWLYTEVGLTAEVLKTVDRFVTARTQTYRMQVIGHFAEGGPSVRVEAVVDTNRGRPRIVYYRDLSELGKGFPLNKK